MISNTNLFRILLIFGKILVVNVNFSYGLLTIQIRRLPPWPLSDPLTLMLHLPWTLILVRDLHVCSIGTGLELSMWHARYHVHPLCSGGFDKSPPGLLYTKKHLSFLALSQSCSCLPKCRRFYSKLLSSAIFSDIHSLYCLVSPSKAVLVYEEMGLRDDVCSTDLNRSII